jgi:glycosyltransferase involved in cell wall biosynthesis
LIGKINHDKVLDYLKAGDTFILNTGYEGFSHVLLEAMAAGIPIVTTNVGGNHELIDPSAGSSAMSSGPNGSGQAGILVEYNNKKQLKNAILKLYKDKDLREKFIKNAQEKVKEFSKENMIKKTIEVLNKL